MIPMQTEVTVIGNPRYAGTKGVVTGKSARTDLYTIRTEALVFYGKVYPKPHGTELNLYPGEFEIAGT